ncbi:MAG: biotin carboxylase N-terminal domain-containing protein [Myxococcota bacterium]|jgi:acetyl/propionyl-CoA carboxylase alpha subunit/acetyl-CoA carboxylase carboxyltransferase component|nr:biotin carboxylase N-terminal domain-containing protein [Myxococcota bacterium]
MAEIKRLAIVNRGEAAMRCVRAVKTLRAHERSDLEVVALFTQPDREAPFVRQADRAIEISHPGGAVSAYLDHDGVLAALKQVEADAVWPGWGFVAESPDFVDRLAEAGITFLGPTADAMRSLGDKITSKLAAEEASVPVSPWSGGELKDEHDALEHARSIGFPIVIKATAGGGGRGIRMIDGEEELAEGFRSAAAEAKGAFGDDRLFLEKRVENGRHIEVQIAADLHGNVVAIGSRDCSVQRRHQKVLEEAPPPDLSASLRGDIEAAAVRIASHVDYSGVGTVEFLLQGDAFYFLEVNPRLQVEHGITEEITGIDLVQLQVRIARGESIKGIEVAERGVAIEARLCAEDPDQGFLPSPGKIVRFEPPMGPRVRIDSGVVAGSTVPPDFDSLVTKLIAVGKDRDDALARLECVLEDLEVVIEGGATNRGYLLEVLGSEEYRGGAVDTGWLDRRERQTSAATGPLAQDSFVAASILAYQRRRAASRLNFYSDVSRIAPERIPASRGQQIDVSYEGESYRTTVYATGAWRYRVHLDGCVVGAYMREEGDNRARLQIDDRVRRLLYDASDLGLRIEIDGHPYRYSWQTAGQVLSGTPAMVVAVHAKEGDTVQAGTPLGLVEAMKMEIAFHAPVSGVVTEVRVRPGQQVSAGEVLLVIDPVKSEGDAAAPSARLALPEQVDALAVLFQPDGGDPLGTPDLLAADRAERPARRAAIDAVLEEVRRVLLGFDANPERSERLVAFLEAPVPEGVSLGFLEQLSRIRDALSSFVDTEELFINAPQASISGEVGPSNAARFRMFVRRLRASGAGIAEEFLDLVRRALAHYDVKQLEPSDALERAVLRLFASQVESELRLRLVLAVVHHLTALAEAGIEFDKDAKLSGTLIRITRMRGRLSDTIADASQEANYVLYEKREVDKAAEQRSRDLEAWLRESESKPTEPSAGVMLEVAAAAKRVFDRVGNWLAATDPSLREIALAAHVQRVYSPAIPAARSFMKRDGVRVLCFEYPDVGLVVAATPGERDKPVAVTKALIAATERLIRADQKPAHSMELLISIGEGDDPEAVVAEVAAEVRSAALPCRLVVGLILDDGDDHCKTFEAKGDEGVGFVENPDYLELHPETAERISLGRLGNFELERLPGEEGIYAFYGRSRQEPGDERVFVLADARDRTPGATADADKRTPAFVRIFHRAARSLRTVLQARDPRRRLQWNRIAISVAPAILLDRETAAKLARRLLPATRHLGLEKVTVRLSRLDPESPDTPAQPLEVVITDTGPQMEISWREPHDEPLQPAGDYERKVVAARRRRRVYPYEIISMLTSGGEGRLADEMTEDVARTTGRVSGQPGVPRGTFEEYDLDDSVSPPRATPIDREPGRNTAAVVFGVISTPTDKHPEGMKRVLALSDPTLGMGALSIPECDRLVAGLGLAERLGVPFEWVPVSSGAKIAMDSGTENLDATARVVRRIVNFTQAGGEINVIVQGTNVGAQSYFDALATMLMHTRGALIMTPRASMVLTGRAALEASGAVAAEDEEAIGGYERIMGPNGQAQYYARNLAEAYQTLFDYYRYTYVAPGESRPRMFETEDADDRSVCDVELASEESFDFKTVGEIFDDKTNPGRKRPFDMRSVMAAVVDQDGGHLERWRQMVGAETAIVWDAHLGGLPTTVIGIESRNIPRDGYRPFDGPESWTGGTLFPLSSKKVARAINAASGRRPVVVLANLSGFDGSPESLRKLQLEYGAEIATAVVNFDGPLLFQVISRYHGGAYVVFSQELNDSMKAFALSGSYASVIGGGPAAKVVFARDVRVRVLADDRVKRCERELRVRGTEEAREALDSMIENVTLEKQAELANDFDEVHSVERAREVGSLERIIEPDTLRETLIGELRSMLGKS